MCTFVTPMPGFGFKAFRAEFALNAVQTCRNSTWQALFATHRNALQTKITIRESYDAIFVTNTIPVHIRMTVTNNKNSLNEHFTNKRPQNRRTMIHRAQKNLMQIERQTLRILLSLHVGVIFHFVVFQIFRIPKFTKAHVAFKLHDSRVVNNMSLQVAVP